MEEIKIFIAIALILSAIDLTLTHIYVEKYLRWQPNKPYRLIERNPLLRFLWKKLGLTTGTIIGAIIILGILYLILTNVHEVFIGIFMAFLLWTIYNHARNFKILNKLIKKYPHGRLPEKIFGKVEGNN